MSTAAHHLKLDIPSFIFKALILARAAMSTKHSRLLQLPLDIRLLIWTYICGDKLLHIHQDNEDDEVVYRICRSPDSEEIIHKRFTKRGNYSTKSLPEYADPWSYHRTCELFRHNLDLRFLHVCKSIYEEAKQIPYQSNIFSFPYLAMLTLFHRTFPPQHRDRVRRLHLHMDMGPKIINHQDDKSWQDTLSLRLIPAFKNITHINISVVLGSTACWRAELPKNDTDQLPRWLHAVLALQALPLETATVMIYDDVKRCDYHYSDPQNSGLHAEGLSWSHRRRRTIKQDTAE